MAQNSRAPSRAGQSSSGTTSSDTTTTAPAQVANTGRSGQFKVASPDLYYGDRKKLRQFIQQVKLNFLFHPESVNTEEKKVVYASTYLRGAAFDWFEPYLVDFLNNPESRRTPRTQEIFQRFHSFQLAIEQVYGDVDTVKEATRDLQGLRQQGSVADYTSKFHQLASRLNWDQTALTATFYKGLKDAIKDELARLDQPDELMPLIEIATKIDNRMWERRQEKGKGGNFTPYNRYQANTYRTKPRTPGYYPPGRDMPMDLDATKRRFRKQGKGQKISNEQRQERFKKNLCLYCGKPGHRAKECKASKQQLSATEGTPEEPKTPYTPQRKNWAKRSEMGKKGDPRGDNPRGQLQRSTPETQHDLLSWSACYDDSCRAHMSDKDDAGWYPRKPRQSHQSVNALFAFNDDEPEWTMDNDDDEPGPEAIREYAEVLEIKKPDYVRILTNLWTRVECYDPDCELATQHEHVTYDPEAVPKEQGKAFTIEFCKKKDCPDNGRSEFHSHQGSDKRESQDSITLNELEHGWETITDPEEIESDEDVSSFNLEEAESAKISEEFATVSEEFATVSDYHTWREPYGHFLCTDMSCPYREIYKKHEHFRNYTKEERELLGIYLVSNVKEARTPCNEILGCSITGMHTHRTSEEPKN